MPLCLMVCPALPDLPCPAWLQAADLLEAVAHRIVRLLVRQGWTLADLDVLPFGVALPLRQVSRASHAAPTTAPHGPESVMAPFNDGTLPPHLVCANQLPG